MVPACAFQDTLALGKKASLVPTEEAIRVLGSRHTVSAQ